MKYLFPYESLRDFALIEIGAGIVEGDDGELKASEEQWTIVDNRVHELQRLQRKENGLKQVRELFMKNPETISYAAQFDKDALEFQVKSLVKLNLISPKQVDKAKSIEGKLVLNNMTHPQSLAVAKEIGDTIIEPSLTGCSVKMNEYTYSVI